MPHYRYRALSKTGEIILGDVEAPPRARRCCGASSIWVICRWRRRSRPASAARRAVAVGRRTAEAARAHHVPAPAGAVAEIRIDGGSGAADAGGRHQQGGGAVLPPGCARRSPAATASPRRWSAMRRFSNRSTSRWCAPARPRANSKWCCGRLSRTARGASSCRSALVPRSSIRHSWSDRRWSFSSSSCSMWCRSSSRCSTICTGG